MTTVALSTNDEKHHHDKFSDPVIVGPGVWYVLHSESYAAKSPEEIESFIKMLNRIISGFKCLKCRNHAEKYLKDNNISKYKERVLSTGENIGMFFYVWEFHNAVNTRINKPTVDWQTALSKFSSPDEGVCSKACGGGVDHTDSDNSKQPIKTLGTSQHLNAPLPFIPMKPLSSNVANYVTKIPNVVPKVSNFFGWE
ncbi:MAG: hypothetical protein Solumvirus3_24 [Solumvirus sp.]|uniref:Sulfhydryl oxidase n=1 Tax=Solumvirus sp. TaxID=2487773 RepID=A0A3G5AGN0_9VIRU|nr:MAG: hypothetical protein Solumvirus3_24 [Solumvirus sp.]